MIVFNGTIYQYKEKVKKKDLYIVHEPMCDGKVWVVLKMKDAYPNGKESNWEMLGKFWRLDIAELLAKAYEDKSIWRYLKWFSQQSNRQEVPILDLDSSKKHPITNSIKRKQSSSSNSVS